MPILIVCSPSTGSSLLRRILNRHSQLYCGPETSLLCKRELYENWNRAKTRLFSKLRPLKNMGWVPIRGINVEEDQILNMVDFKLLVDNSDSFKVFIKSYFEKALKKYDKSEWIEKTPSNALAISLFLSLFPEGKILHITRNPLHAVASLMFRGKDVLNACAVNLLNSIAITTHKNYREFYIIKYEDLVIKPKETLRKMCSFLNVDSEEHMLIPKSEEEGVTKMKGWNYNETDSVKKGSLNRYDTLSENQKLEINYAISNLKLEWNDKKYDYKWLFKKLDYDMLQQSIDSSYLQREMLKNLNKIKLHRTLKGLDLSGKEFPFYL